MPPRHIGQGDHAQPRALATLQLRQFRGRIARHNIRQRGRVRSGRERKHGEAHGFPRRRGSLKSDQSETMAASNTAAAAASHHRSARDGSSAAPLHRHLESVWPDPRPGTSANAIPPMPDGRRLVFHPVLPGDLPRIRGLSRRQFVQDHAQRIHIRSCAMPSRPSTTPAPCSPVFRPPGWTPPRGSPGTRRSPAEPSGLRASPKSVITARTPPSAS